MNKQNFLTRMLLLLALIVGSVNGAWADNYEKVTSTAGITDGQYLIVYETGNVAFNGALTADGAKNTIDVTITDGKIASTAKTDAAAVTISVTGGSIKGATKYIGGKSGSNTLTYSDEVITTSFSIDGSGNFVATSNTSILRFNKASDQLRFRYYKSTGYSGQQAIQLYKLVASVKTDPTITFSNGIVRVGKTLDLSNLFTSNSSGAVTYSITEGGSYATIDGSELTGVAEGNVTVKAAQTADGAYNAGEKTATITVNAALTLSSIAITTVPDKTTYTEGETFDATGMVVTATYSDESTDDVTALTTWTPSGVLSTSDTEITISYTENGKTKTTTQSITVNAYIQPNPVTIQMTNSLFGQEVHTSGKADEAMTFEGTQDRVKVTYDVPKGSYYYFNTSNTRPYNSCTLDYAAPSGFAITKIEFTSDGSNWQTATPSAGAMTATKQWEGFAKHVTFLWAETGTRIKTVVVTLAQTEPIEVTSAGYATYVSDADLDYSGLAVKAYKALVSEKAITFTKVTTVPAGEGVLLQGAANTYNVPVAASAVAAWADSDNAFVRGSDAAVVSDNGNGTYNYVLSTDDKGVVGFYKANGNTVANNRAYLQSTTDAARLAFNFDDEAGEATGISEMKNVKADAAIYNLNGVRVKNMTKGLYIMNGKKVIVK